MKLTISLYEISPGFYYSFYKDFPTKSDILDELADIKKKIPEVKIWYFESINANGNRRNKIFIFGQIDDKEFIAGTLNSIKEIPNKRILVQVNVVDITITRNVVSRDGVNNEFRDMLTTTERRNVTLVQ